MLRSTKSLSRRRRARLIKRPPIFFCLSFARAYSQSTLFRRPTPQAWLVRFLCLLLPPLLLFPWWQPLLPTAPSSLLPGPLSPLLLLLVSTSCLYLLSRGVFNHPLLSTTWKTPIASLAILPSTRTLSNLPRHSSPSASRLCPLPRTMTSPVARTWRLRFLPLLRLPVAALQGTYFYFSLLAYPF